MEKNKKSRKIYQWKIPIIFLIIGIVWYFLSFILFMKYIYNKIIFDYSINELKNYINYISYFVSIITSLCIIISLDNFISLLRWTIANRDGILLNEFDVMANFGIIKFIILSYTTKKISIKIITLISILCFLFSQILHVLFVSSIKLDETLSLYNKNNQTIFSYDKNLNLQMTDGFVQLVQYITPRMLILNEKYNTTTIFNENNSFIYTPSIEYFDADLREITLETWKYSTDCNYLTDEQVIQNISLSEVTYKINNKSVFPQIVDAYCGGNSLCNNDTISIIPYHKTIVSGVSDVIHNMNSFTNYVYIIYSLSSGYYNTTDTNIIGINGTNPSRVLACNLTTTPIIASYNVSNIGISLNNSKIINTRIIKEIEKDLLYIMHRSFSLALSYSITGHTEIISNMEGWLIDSNEYPNINNYKNILGWANVSLAENRIVSSITSALLYANRMGEKQVIETINYKNGIQIGLNNNLFIIITIIYSFYCIILFIIILLIIKYQKYPSISNTLFDIIFSLNILNLMEYKNKNFNYKNIKLKYKENENKSYILEIDDIEYDDRCKFIKEKLDIEKDN